MIRDHRPYFIKAAYLKLQSVYTAHFIEPQLSALGTGHTFIKPWHIEVFGGPIALGKCATVIAAKDSKVRLAVWSQSPTEGRVDIGDCVMLCPGVRISSAAAVSIGDNCMVASRAYITDCDWHDVYNRMAMGKSEPVSIADNVWIGDSAIICKGVRIGKNSVVGAGAVVVDSIPANTIAAGNPAKIVRQLDSERPFITRSQWFQNPEQLFRDIDRLDRAMLRRNTLWHWLRYLFFPARGE